ncbi:MAG TPA: DUF2934 domain-containing protein [Bryobacteraceae bacterium]|nr:DUF2934 domain-containing protein [Bryobacteraceae bacterium]
MAKKRINGLEPQSTAGAAPARQPRKRTKSSSAPLSPSPEVTPVTGEPAAQSVNVAESDTRAAQYTPEFEEIARTAYSYWLERGGQGGSPEDDWLRAERELRSRRSFEANA